MQIDIISDTVCPWCFIGKRRLDRAIEERADIQFDVRWRPYRLDPTVPKSGLERKAYLRTRFGEGPEIAQRAELIRELGEKEEIAFRFADIARTPNTLDSHRLIRWAGTAGAQNAVVELLFSAYFEQGRDIGDPEVLEWVADQCGMDVDIVRALLASDDDVLLVEREDALARRMGINGVPTFIFENKYLLSGAQETEALLSVIDKVDEEANAAEQND